MLFVKININHLLGTYDRLLRCRWMCYINTLYIAKVTAKNKFLSVLLKLIQFTVQTTILYKNKNHTNVDQKTTKTSA